MNIFLKSYAKINFGLCITEKRPDGYHNIETIFYPLSLADTITIRPAETFSLQTNSSLLNNEDTESNLMTKALRLLEKETGRLLPAAIELEKRIPIGAGLGGGSSNAAAVLLGLMQLYKITLSKERLEKLALQLGSDVPYFLLRPQPAYAELRGEKLTPIDFAITKPLLLVNPGIHIPTGWAYGQCKPAAPEFSLKTLAGQKKKDFFPLMGKVVNDFQEPVFAANPEIKKLHDRLSDLDAEFVLMSGSGSSIFAVFPDMERLQSARAELPENYFTYIENPRQAEN